MNAHDLRVEEQVAPYLVAPVLTDYLDTFASAPEGFKRLRELVLNLAVRGRLVPQDAKDEPAEKLLQRIRKERANRSARREKVVDAVSDDEIPYTLPSSWCWIRLPEICHDWGQKVPDGPFTYIDVGAIDNERGIITTATQLLDASNAPSRARKIVRHGTVLYSTVRPYLLNIAIVDRSYEPEPIASTAFAVLHPLIGIDGRYLFQYLRSQPFIDFVGSKMVGVAYPAINDSNFFSGLFPLPPAAEQSRIVAKVEELMALIDRLEAKVSHGETARGKLLDALLTALADSPDAATTADAWAQLAPHFDLLLQTPADVGRLQQTLLTLAVKGRLVPQDPNDEPAAELLKRIRAEKERLVAEGKIRRDKPISAFSADEQSFVLPSGWRWTQFGEVSVCRDGERIPVSSEEREKRNKVYDYYGASGIIDKIDGYLFDGTLLLVGEDGANLINRSTPIAFLAQGKFWVNNHAHVIDGLDVNLLDYLCLFINAISLEPYVTGTAQPKMNQAKLNGIPIALPPAAEQRRIVAAVASLTALCDRLRERLAARRDLSAKLAAALTETALQ